MESKTWKSGLKQRLEKLKEKKVGVWRTEMHQVQRPWGRSIPGIFRGTWEVSMTTADGTWGGVTVEDRQTWAGVGEEITWAGVIMLTMLVLAWKELRNYRE